MLAPETTAAAPEADAVSPLTLRLFGPFEVHLHGQPLPRLRSRKGQWLLALLTLRHGGEVDRAWLAGTLWPDSSEEAAYASLRNSLKDLRRALGPEAGRLRSPTPRTLSLDLAGAHADVVAFEKAIAEGGEPALERAVALYRGPLLEEWVEAWVLPERQAREAACLTALETLAAAALARGDPAAAERSLRQAVALDPLRETAQRALMQALAAGGNDAAATQVYRELRLRLHRELNAAPDPETQALYQQLRAQAQGAADGATGRQSLRSGVGVGVGVGVGTDPLTPTPTPTPTRSLSGRPLVPSLPAGTVTFLFTDVERSSQLWERYPEAMKSALAHHDLLLRQAIQAHGGRVFKTVGDAFYAAFATAPAALAAVLAAQQALLAEAWEETGPLRVRMALHTGIAEERDGEYFGPTLNRLARLLQASHGGQVLLSLPTEELVRDTLPEGASLRSLGEHRLKDLVRPEQVFQLLHLDLPSTFPPLRSLAAFTHNLPLQWTSFIGREQEMAELKRLLPTTPLLTLTGPGGGGKTRLALQVAADLLDAYPDGVWLVELAALAEPSLVPQTVAITLGVPEQAGRPLTATLIEHLRSRSLLLLLDNCEHLRAACGELVEALLRACPNVRVLATSRERLGLTGERVYLTPSLSLPELPPPSVSGAARVAAVLQSEAVRLFVERAVYSQPQFALTERNAPVVAQLCQRLDGVPLAIELAAARVRALPVERIAARLDDRFRLLTGGSRTALPRQQTLRALLDWSYDLLSASERRLLCRLSVFAGGWTLEAAEGVCAGDGIEAGEVFDLLTQLVDKSLVVYEEQEGEARYRLLETVRQYSGDRLLEAGETAAVRGQHTDFFVRLAEQAEPELPGVEQTAWLERLEREHDNLRAALTWSRAEGQGEAGLRLGGALWWYWAVRGYLGEGREHLAGLLALPPVETRTAARVKALKGAGLLALYQGDLGASRTLLLESVAIFRDLGCKQGIANPVGALGVVAYSQGEHGAARALYEESLAIERERGDQPEIAHVLNHLGRMARTQGDFGTARVLLEESRAIFLKLGHKQGIGWSLVELGWLARCERNYGAAQALWEESLADFREVGHKQGITGSLNSLAQLAREQGDHGNARAFCEESLAICREIGDRAGIVTDLEGLAAVAVAQAQPERAARLVGAAEGVREAIGTPLPRSDRVEHNRSVAAVRAALGEETFAATQAEGRVMTLEQAIAYALDAGQV
jgi:predicted ATPase/class 3 adenylate cyclase/DNA-binding SARP family transcriptional activator